MKERGYVHGKAPRRGRGRLVALGLVLTLVAIAGIVLAADAGGARTTALRWLGDERRNDIVSGISSLSVRRVETSDMVAMPHTGVNPLGVNTFLEQEAEVSKRRQTLQMIRDAGIGWIRQQFPWEDIEVPGKGQYWDEKYNQSTWDKYDNIVDLANEYGIQMIVRLDLPPKWANPNNPWPHTPPERLEDYGDFVNTVVSRYKGKVKYYQLWNEPNLAIEWGNKPVNAREYVDLLKIGYQRAKEADPDAVILSAALAPTIEESWQALNDQIYLQQMYDAGAKDYFDIMSVMAYGLRSGPDDRRLDEMKDVNFSRPMLIREIMVKNGDASKPVWASEMGWNAQPDSLQVEPTFGRVSEDLQARYTVRAFQRAADEWPWMGVMNLWFFKRASDSEKDQPFYYFRMVEPDFETHPVYDAVKEYGDSPPEMHRGYHQEDHWAIQYEGKWSQAEQPKASLGKVMETGEAGGTMSLLFSGTDLDLVISKGPSLAKAYIRIDGMPRVAGELPQDDDGRAVLDPAVPAESWQQRVPVASGLTNGQHRLEITATGPFVLDGLIVSTREIPFILQPLPRLATSLVMIGGALAVAMVARNRRKRFHNW